MAGELLAGATAAGVAAAPATGGASLLIPAIIAGSQFLFGAGQELLAGSRRRKAQREFEKNKYEIPSGVKSMLEVIKNVASQTKMPGYEQYLQQIQGATSQGVETAQRAGQSSSDVLGALQKLYGKQMDMQTDLAIANAQNYQRNQLQYANALNTMGQYETQKWQYNTLYPYMQQMTGAGQMAQAGNQNIGSAISSGLSLWSANAQMKQTQDNFDKWYNAQGLNNQGTSPMPSNRLPLPPVGDFGNLRNTNNPASLSYVNTRVEPNPPYGSNQSWTPYY